MRFCNRSPILLTGLLVVLQVAVSASAQSVPATENIVAQVKPAVVMIETDRGWGTGFFVSCDGYLITNNHVLEDAQRATVIYRNRWRLTGEVIKTDPEMDLALLKVNANTSFPTVVLGDSDEVKEGMAVAVTGYPLPNILVEEFGSSLQCSTSQGIVSAIRGTAVPGIFRSRPLVQYDAGSTQGNSGGPIYSIETGEVIGVVFSGIRGTEFISLGIPINEVKLLLHRAGIIVQSRRVDPSSSEAFVPPGDVSRLNIIGPDKSIASLFANRTIFPLAPKDYREMSDQILSNAGYYSCYGKLAPPVSEPRMIGKKLVFTGNDGRVWEYDPAKALTSNPVRPLFNVDKRYMFFPAQGNEHQICFSAGTPTFLAKEKTDKGRLFLAILAAAAAGYSGQQVAGMSVTKSVPTIDSSGSIIAVNSSNGNLDWEYQCGFVSAPILKDNRVFFGGMGIYGVLDATTGKEIWVHREKLGGTKAKWYDLTPGKDALSLAYLTSTPVEVKFHESFPGYTLLGKGDLKLMAVRAVNGKTIWESKVTKLSDQANPLAVGIAVDQRNHTILLTRFSQVFAYSFDGKRIWTYGNPPEKSDKKRGKDAKEIPDVLTDFATGIELFGDNVFLGGDDGKVYCLNPKTGNERWTFTGLKAMGDPAFIEGTLYCGSVDGWMYAIDPGTGTLKWKVDTGAYPVGKPLIYEGALYFSSQGASGLDGELCSVYLPKSER